ncbi:MAG: ABC transporter permease [Nitrososphaeria archaeon]
MRPKAIVLLGYMFGFLWLRRNLLSMIWLFSTPFTILFLFYVIAGESALPSALTGTYLMLFIGAGVAVIGDEVWNKHELKFQDILVASPVSAFDYMAGIAFAELFFTSPGIILLLTPLLLFKLSAYGIFTLIVVPLITWMLVSAVGFYFSTYVPNSRNGWQISTLLNLVLAILPPIFYPIEAIPSMLRPLAYAIPTTHAALLLKQSIGIITLSMTETLFSWSFLVISFTLSIALAVRNAQWRES